MKKNSNIKIWVHSVAITTTITSLVLAIMIVGAEEYGAFKGWLKANFYHHWLGKSVLTMTIFIFTILALQAKNSVLKLSTAIAAEAFVVIGVIIIIAGYFLMQLFGVV